MVGFRDFLAAKAHPCKAEVVSAQQAEDAATVAGYADAWEAITLLNAFGDTVDINAALEGATAPYDPSLLKDWPFKRFMCFDLSDVLMGHSSWFTYSTTNRSYKHYHIHTLPEYTAASGLSFSSYLGCLESLAHSYLLSSGLVMIQTSLGVLDLFVNKDITPKSMLAWQCVRIAHALSHTGEDWFLNLQRETSGNYNNEHMIFDTKKFVPGQPLQPGFFFLGSSSRSHGW